MSDQQRYLYTLNEEYKFQTVRQVLAWIVYHRYITGALVSLFIVLLTLSIKYEKEIQVWFEDTGHHVDKWFRNPKNDWMYAIILLVLLRIYKQYPTFFAPATVLVVLGVMVLLCFQYNNFNAEHVLNKWLIVAAFVLPVLPLIAVMVKVNKGWIHWAVMATYVALVAILLIVNPNSFLGKYNLDTPSVYVVGLIGLFSMMCVYFNKSFTKELWHIYITKVGFVLLCLLTAAFAFQYAIRFFMQKPEFSANWLLMFAVIVGFVVMFFAVLLMRLPRLNLGGMAGKLWLAVLFCRFQDFLKGDHRIAFYILIVELALITWYFVSTLVYTKIEEGEKGKQLVNAPISLGGESIKQIPYAFKANYAVSFWVYFNPQSKEFNAASSTFVNVLDYGGKPKVTYNASTSTMRVSVRMPVLNKVPTTREIDQAYTDAYDAAINAGGTEVDGVDAGKRASNAVEFGTTGEDVLMADLPKVPLQRWHHIVLAYNNGTFDVFLNGVLFRSVPGVMTDVLESTVLIGAPEGNRGKVCNVVFYQGGTDPTASFTKKGNSITADKVTKLYNTFASKNPPIVSRIFSIAPEPSYGQVRF
jgi:hypothetical protein